MEKFTQIKKINETVMPEEIMGTWMAKPDPAPQYQLGAIKPEIGEVTKSEPTKFVSKLFESRQMAHVFHLQTDSYSQHIALDAYYNGILELIDNFVEVYSGQYNIIEDYETIEGESKGDNCIEYFIELSQFIKNTRYIAILKEDTHLQNIIDEMVELTYKTQYKLKYLK